MKSKLMKTQMPYVVEIKKEWLPNIALGIKHFNKKPVYTSTWKDHPF